MNRIICSEIPSGDFQADYRDLILDITNTYDGLLKTLSPFTSLQSLDVFEERFDSLHRRYLESYQKALSEPRVNAEFTYEKYLQFRKRKETRTSYPILKIAFERLHELIDKWIDNDIWLAMSIDTLLKTLNRHLGHIADLKSKDREAGFVVYDSCINKMGPYLEIIATELNSVRPLQGFDQSTAIAVNC